MGNVWLNIHWCWKRVFEKTFIACPKLDVYEIGFFVSKVENLAKLLKNMQN